MRKELKNIFILSGIIALICACYFLPNIISHIPLTYGTDIKPEQFFFNYEFTNLMSNFFKTKAFPFYSWSLFLGNNFYASQSFYNMGDLYTYFGLLFRNMQFFDKTMLLEIIKFFVSAYSMYYLLSIMKFSTKVKMMGAIAYAFSGWAIFWSGQTMFLSFYTFVPLYLAGIELFLTHNKKFLFLISTALLLFTHWYFFYTLSLFTPLYYIYRYALLKKDFHHFLADTAKLIGVYFIGVAITGILTLPTIYYMLDNNRVGQLTNVFLFNHLEIYFHQLAAMFVPNYLYIYGSNVFETNWHVTRELCLWAGSFTSLGALFLFTLPKNQFKKYTFYFYAVLLIVLLLPIGNAMMHGFSEPSFRWSFILTFVNILTACHILENWDTLDFNLAKPILFTILSLCVLIIPVSALLTGKFLDLISNYSQQWLFYGLSAVAIYLVYFIMTKGKKQRLTWLLILTVAEFAISGSSLYIMKMDRSASGSYEFVNRVTHVLQTKENELNTYLDSLEPVNTSQYYRVFVPHDSLYWSYSHNMSVVYQLHGLMTYDTTYSPSVNKLRELAPQVKGFNSDMIFDIQDPDLLRFLNVKYALVISKDELPGGVSWRLINDNYRDGIQVYRNDDYRELGTTYNRIVSYDQYKNENMPLSSLLDVILCQKEEVETITSYLKDSVRSSLENISYLNNQLTATCHVQEDTFLVITLPYDAGWKVFVNNQQVPTYNVNGGFLGIPVSQGENSIEMYFTPQGFKNGAILSFVAMTTAFLLFLYEIYSVKKNHLNKQVM